MDDFDRAWVAAHYLLGDRDEALARAACGRGAPLVQALSQPSREQRAQVLAGELARLSRALDEASVPWR